MKPISPKSGHNFAQIENAQIQRSQFKRDCTLKTTFDEGYLIPIFIDEALPGDTFNLKMTAFGRLATPIYPIMDNMYVDTFFFFVPNRLLWDNWQKFMGEQANPGDSTDYIIPHVSIDTVIQNGTIWDYFGLPTYNAFTLNVNAFYSRAYNLIWNEWFRDQNLQPSVVVDKDDGPDSRLDYVLLRRGKRHDYFTSCLPWPQKGDAIELPLGTSAPVVSSGMNFFFEDASANDRQVLNGGPDGGGRTGLATALSGDAAGTGFIWGSQTGLETDLSAATAATVNQLRQAFQVQRLIERDARGGTRYTEIVRAHFGVMSPDARLQRPEYLGGGSSVVNISPVAATTNNAASGLNIGDLSAFGTVQAHGHGFNSSFTEHGVIIGLACLRSDLTYQYGMDRLWSRRTRYDFYWPALSHIGEQSVLQKEIYSTGVVVDDDVVFGYQERYAEYRYKPSKVTGLFRSNDPVSLDAWHLAEEYTAAPVLNADFIQQNSPVDRCIAVPSEPHLIFDAYFDLTCSRPMPMFGTPGFIDHF